MKIVIRVKLLNIFLIALGDRVGMSLFYDGHLKGPDKIPAFQSIEIQSARHVPIGRGHSRVVPAGILSPVHERRDLFAQNVVNF